MQSDEATVLIVEDDRNVLDITGFMLELAGYHVLTASNATDALSAVREHPDIGLVFTDVNMPGDMDGIEMLNELRRLGLSIPVLVVSGDVGGVEHRIGIRTSFLPKPYDRRQLLQAVEAALHS
ncbi:two-component system chemotaxis response regulator CheY [Luteibacter rhizovicinus]|uniref:Two-component system chemotaxis response regulator CheY n=1 Tax=Luteibacter rhizovicinus TaxID=242606 RepID=A0A4R3YN18_9GAMM|nr:response regulator [Luteibacter rhizovicinus]TCV94037.1 two-component system chemotaxis response regulator CheY [Luteibacter rhizovicinus]